MLGHGSTGVVAGWRGNLQRRLETSQQELGQRCAYYPAEFCRASREHGQAIVSTVLVTVCVVVADAAAGTVVPGYMVLGCRAKQSINGFYLPGQRRGEAAETHGGSPVYRYWAAAPPQPQHVLYRLPDGRWVIGDELGGGVRAVQLLLDGAGQPNKSHVGPTSAAGWMAYVPSTATWEHEPTMSVTGPGAAPRLAGLCAAPFLLGPPAEQSVRACVRGPIRRIERVMHPLQPCLLRCPAVLSAVRGRLGPAFGLCRLALHAGNSRLRRVCLGREVHRAAV